MNDSRAPLETAVIFVTNDGLRSLAEAAGDHQSVSIALQYLAADIESNPEKLKLVDTRFVSRISSLVLGVDADLDAPLLNADD